MESGFIPPEYAQAHAQIIRKSETEKNQPIFLKELRFSTVPNSTPVPKELLPTDAKDFDNKQLTYVEGTRYTVKKSDMQLRKSNFGTEIPIVLAKDSETGTDLIVKLSKVDEEDIVREKRLSELYKEASALAKLEHPHIVKIFEVISLEIDGIERPGIVMEKLEEIPSGKMGLSDVAQMLEQIGSALDYMNEQKIVHHDVKPQNIMKRGSEYVLIDGDALVDINYGIDSTDDLLFTEGYRDPAEEDGVTDLIERGDQYSLAVSAFNLLRGQKRNQNKYKYNIDEYVSINALENEVDYGIPANVLDVLRKATSYDRKERYSNNTEFATAFRTALTEWEQRKVGFTQLTVETINRITGTFGFTLLMPRERLVSKPNYRWVLPDQLP